MTRLIHKTSMHKEKKMYDRAIPLKSHLEVTRYKMKTIVHTSVLGPLKEKKSFTVNIIWFVNYFFNFTCIVSYFNVFFNGIAQKRIAFFWSGLYTVGMHNPEKNQCAICRCSHW